MITTDHFIEQLSESLFWDTDRDRMDTDAHAAFIIIRVMERGTSVDVRSTWDFYGAERIKECLLKAPALSPKTIAFFANQFDLPRDAFRAYGRAENWTR